MICVHSKDLSIAVPEGPDTCGSGISLGETLLIALLDRDWEEKLEMDFIPAPGHCSFSRNLLN